ncbi:MAG: hypothetical protein OXC30_04525 [Alphaproteobacteria bacterium]|nr:hypothetical protein [Alphaproteobacteria bacterium]
MNPDFQKKSASRLIATQAIFYLAHAKRGGGAIKEVIQSCLAAYAEELVIDQPFCTNIISTWKKHTTEIDQCIEKNLSASWSLDRLDPVVLSIIRAGASEAFLPETETPLILSEYIDIGHAFFIKKEPQFIHGILHTIVSKIRSEIT